MATVRIFSGETIVNTALAGFQGRASAAGLATGGSVITWDGYNASNGGHDIFLQRFGSTSVPAGAETLVNSGATSGFQYEPSVAGLASGGFVVAWSSAGAGSYDIVSQRYLADGKPIGSLSTISTATFDEYAPSVTGLKDGGYVVSWYAYRATRGAFDIFAQRVKAEGTPRGGEFLSDAAASSSRSDSAVAALLYGGFVIAWAESDPLTGRDDIMAQRYRADGTAIGSPSTVNTTAAGDRSTPAVVTLSNGGYAIAWTAIDFSNGESNVFARAFRANGAPAGDEVLVNTTIAGNQAQPAVAALPDGGFLVSWASYKPVSEEADVFARRFNGRQEAIGTETLVNRTTTGDQFLPTTVTLADQSILIAWQGANTTGGTSDVYARTIGAPAPLDAMTSALEWVDGTSGNDLIRVRPEGLNAGDQVIGYGGYDTLLLTAAGTLNLAGATVIGVEALQGTSGDDTIGGSGAPEKIEGRAGDDVLAGDALGPLAPAPEEAIQAGDDHLDGGGGADRIYGDASGDMIADPGPDGREGTAVSGGNDTLVGGTGDDLLVGDAGGGFDSGSYSPVAGGDDELDGGTGNDTLVGDALLFMLARDSDADVFGGDDILRGGDGSDIVIGETGGDLSANGEGSAYAGADQIDGGKGNDILYGDARGRIFSGSTDGFIVAGSDTVLGGDGNDTIYGDAGGEMRSEEASLRGGIDRLEGGRGRDTIFGDAGGDIIARLSSSVVRPGNDTILGGEGDDVLVGDAGGNMRSDDTFSEISGSNDIIDGGEGSDILYGDARGDILVDPVAWSGGNDRLSGGDGDDVLYGDAGGTATAGGDDILEGGAGKDTLRGGKGADRLIGGSGNDRFIFAAGDGGTTADEGDTLVDYRSGSDRIGLSGGLSFADLELERAGNDTVVRIEDTGEVLATILGVTTIGARDFFEV